MESSKTNNLPSQYIQVSLSSFFRLRMGVQALFSKLSSIQPKNQASDMFVKLYKELQPCIQTQFQFWQQKHHQDEIAVE